MTTFFFFIVTVAIVGFLVIRRQRPAAVLDEEPSNFFATLFSTLESLKCYIKTRDFDQAHQELLAAHQQEVNRTRLLTQQGTPLLIVCFPDPVRDAIMRRALAVAQLYRELLESESPFGSSAVVNGIYRELERIVRLNGGVVPSGQFVELYESYRQSMPK